MSIITAMSPNHAIGYKGSLPWNIPEDLKHFKEITIGHTIIMGRKTFESLPNGALPGRRNIVLSHSLTRIKGCEVFPSLETALNKCIDEVFVIGGATLYAEALAYASHLYITLVHNNPQEADTFFPGIDMSKWEETKNEKHKGFSFVELNRL